MDSLLACNAMASEAGTRHCVRRGRARTVTAVSPPDNRMQGGSNG
jgi:hypothetical protein